MGLMTDEVATSGQYDVRWGLARVLKLEVSRTAAKVLFRQDGEVPIPRETAESLTVSRRV